MSFFDLAHTTEIAVRLRSGCRISRAADCSGLQLDWHGHAIPLGRGPAGLDAALGGLLSGTTLADLRDRVFASDGSDAAAGFLIWMQRMARMGLLDYPLMHDGRVIVTILPQQSTFVPRLSKPGRALGKDRLLSRFATLRRADGRWLLEHPLIACRLAVDDTEVLSILMRWAAGQWPASASSDDWPDASADLIARTLDGLGFLSDDPRSTRNDNADTLRQWEPQDLAFHFHSRRGFHFDPVGGLFPFIDEIEPLPALRPSWKGEAIMLDRAPAGMTSASLTQVIAQRRSSRYYQKDTAVSLHQLGVFLDRVASVSETSTMTVTNYHGLHSAMEVSRRPYPNGGASYELELYAVVDVCDGLDRGVYHYDAGRHALVSISDYSDQVEQMLRDASMATAGMATPQILFAITARFTRVMWKYKSIAYAVILRNTGVLYQTMYLTATDMGLSPCGVGSGDSALFAEVTGLDPIVEGTVGEFLLGGPPAEPPGA